MLSLRTNPVGLTTLSTSLPSNGQGPLLVTYTLARRTTVSINVYRVRDDSTESFVASVVKADQDAGQHTVALRQAELTPGHFLVRLTTGDATLDQPFDVLPRSNNQR
jgi:hypothetical protein